MAVLQPLRPTLYKGSFIHSVSLNELQVLENAIVGVDESGVIRFVERHVADGDVKDVVRGHGWEEWDVVSAGRGFWFPGFVDTHIHASQFPNSGIFGKSTLLDWLNKYTFPLEASLSSPVKATQVYTRCISATLAHGTTTAAYYATISVPSTNLLASLCLSRGQRAFIGRVCMDSSINPPYYTDASPETSLEATKATITHINTIDPNHTLLTPILTPRFAPSCTPTLLSSLGTLARTENLPIQTHIAENPPECALVKSLFPDSRSYTHLYDTHTLLTPRTVLAHAIHLSAEERALIRTRGAKISHCPVSNTSLSSGLCPVRALLNEGLDVGLGTDVSGGYSPSILVAAREASMVSRTLAAVSSATESENRDDALKLSVEECLFLATRGGARCLGLEGKVGGFEVGMEWDAQMVDLGSVGDGVEIGGGDGVEVGGGDGVEVGNVGVWEGQGWEERVAKWMFCGDDRNTRAVWVRGRLVHERLETV